MKSLDSELQSLSELYSRLSDRLAPNGEGGNAVDLPAAVDETIRNQDLFARIEQMNVRLIQLAREWEAISPTLDPDSRERTRRLAGKALEQACRLARLGEERLGMIETYRAKIGSQLGEINRGFRFLSSIKPLKSNFPKFIDSQG